MCETCGCGQPGEYTIHIPGDEKINEQSHDHIYEHPHPHLHTHGHSDKREMKVIEVNRDILSENNLMAERNRGFFEGLNASCYNLVSSPGSGKTSILEKTITGLGKIKKIFVIEGDQQSSMDAERIKKAGAPAIQINTGTACHLDARMVNQALKKLEIARDSLVLIENVGNLVCPALFDLGENKRVVVISVTEGDDKPLKYPYMFASAHLCLINKIDLLPYVDFNMNKAIDFAIKVNHHLEFIEISAKTGEGMQKWFSWIG